MWPHPGSWSLAAAPLPGWWHKNHPPPPDPRGEDTINMCSFHQKIDFPIVVVFNFFQTQKDLKLVFRVQFFRILWQNFFFYHMIQTAQISLTDYVYFQSYSVRHISCFFAWAFVDDTKFISKILNFDFFKNEKRFWSEI